MSWKRVLKAALNAAPLPSGTLLPVATFDTQLPQITDEETGEFINVECTYNIQYTIRR